MRSARLPDTKPTPVFEFVPQGPFQVPTWGRPGARQIDQERAREFWTDGFEELGDARGCYVFTLSRPRTHLPIYVGSTSRTFRQECFSHRNLAYISWGMRNTRGRLHLFLLEYVSAGRGRASGRAILDLEARLIGLAVRRNADLLNIHGVREAYILRVPGVLDPAHGRRSQSAVQLSSALGL